MQQTFRTSLLFAAAAMGCAAAQPTGAWKLIADAPDGDTYQVTLTVTETGSRYSAIVEGLRGGSLTASDIVFANDQLTFKLPHERAGQLMIKLHATENTIQGTLETSDGEMGTISGTRIPPVASPAGKWTVVSRDPKGKELKLTLDIAVSGNRLTGKLVTETGESAEISEGAVEAGQIRLKLMTGEGAYSVSGTLDGDRMQGTYAMPNGKTGSFTAMAAGDRK